jgi:hypothetical protein
MLLIAATVGLVVLVVVLATTVFAGGSSKPAGNRVVSSPATSAQGSLTTGAGAGVTPSSVTVAVLNGTSVPGLARTVANNLQHDGYQIGTVTNAPIQQHTTTTVSYGSGDRSQAQAVAHAIGVDPSTVAVEDVSTQGVAGSQAMVVVTVGADRQH